MLRPTTNVKKPVMSQPHVMEIIPPYARPVLNVVVMPAITERIEKEIAKFENNLHSQHDAHVFDKSVNVRSCSTP